MKAVKVLAPGSAGVQDVNVPKLRPDYVLIRLEAVALNPADWYTLYDFAIAGGTLGNDLAGTVVEVGSGVTKAVKKGDRVAAFVRGSNPLHLDDGAFGEYAVAKGDLVIKVPDSMSFEQGATLGVAVATIALGLYDKLGIAWPDQPTKDPEWVFVNAGSTAMGTSAIQLAKLSGYRVVTTCSPRNTKLVESYGADAVFDYNAPTCAADIQKLTDNKLYYVFDIQADSQSAQICVDALSSETTTKKAIYSSLSPVPQELSRDDVESWATFAYTSIGEGFISDKLTLEPNLDDFELAKKFVKVVEQLLLQNKIKAHPIEVREGGLDAIMHGVDDLKMKKVSGKKLIIQIGHRGSN
ncbi:putative zinc-binding oxidoreductase ToxD [Seiridium cardinale]|uniref:Zinc-binding oxidoreductase ToxD n=1 Tax=Seiridium cardinale TaxID=138064 RepID=A0ABR2XFD7_9PEZI